MANNLRDQFHEITTKKYQDQAVWFLNGFWNDGAEAEAENIWKFTQKFIEIDFQKKKEGNELDEFLSHKFLESLGETLTVVALRDRLKKIDLDFNGKMALIEYLTVKYKKDVKEVVNAPQGSNPEEVKKAQDKLNEVQKELDKQRQVEESVKKAEEENRAAVQELKKQEDEYQRQISTLEAKSKDTNSGAVQRNKAAAELAQLKSEDSLPLRKAKISQEASLRKVEKERKAAEEQTKRVEASYKEAQDYFEQVKRMGGSPLGAIWWMERELKEAQKYLPKSKQKL